MKKSEVILTALCTFLLGLVAGILLSPAKKGFEIGNNSGNNTYTYFGEEVDPFTEITEEDE